MKKLLFVLALISIFSSKIFAQCTANYSWSQTANNTIAFTNTSTGTSSFTIYQWSFGDGSPGSGAQNPVHVYNVPGIYDVCLYIHDSLGCNSVICDSIPVTGVVNCIMTLSTTATLASCSTCTDGSATASQSNGTPPFTYSWQTVPVQTTATATGLAPGSYTCCVTDFNGCTACNTATINYSLCQANFTWSQTTNNTISFINTSTGTGPFTNYYWTFGDSAGTSNQANPSHYYVAPGTYYVCLHISDSTICSSTFCDTITVTGINCNNIAVATTATDASCPTCSDGSAAANGSGGNPPFTYLWNTSATTQSISNLTPGTYSCCITDALGCTACSNAIVGGNGGCSAYFQLNYVSPQTYNAVNLATGAPPLSYIWNWGDNTYSYTAYPTHTYPASGNYYICLAITDAMGCSSTYCDSFYLARLATPLSVITVNVVPPGPSGISNATPQNYCTVFPNPASERLFIDYSLAASANTKITLYDVLGNVIRSVTDDMSEGKHEIIFDIRSLRQGLYMLSLKTSDYSVTRPIAVVK